MFSSSSSYNPFSFTNQIMLESSFTGNENPSSTQQDHPSPPLHFPVSFLDDDNDGLLMSHFLPQQQQILGSGSNLAGETKINTASLNKGTNITNKKRSTVAKEAIPRRRMGKKDRHSKINTAKGPRDRRMRLSLQIARKFFDLQDMLGFDKASKTIDWLFSKSKAAIKELTENFPGAKHICSGGGKCVSSTSESEVVSGIKEIEENIGDEKGAVAIGESLVGVPREIKKGKSRKAVYNPVARESRDKARERARERTREKRKMRGFENSNEANPNELEHVRSSSLLETGENLGQEMNSSRKVVVGEEEEPSTDHLIEHQMDTISIVENFLDIIRSPRSSSTVSYSHNIAASIGANCEEIYPVLAGNWDINNDRVHYNYCTMTNKKLLTGNVQVQNPSAIFMTNQNAQEQNPSPVFMINSNPQELAPSLVFMDPSNAHQQNPSSILMSNSNIDLQSHFLENQFSCNPIFANKYRSLH